MLKNLKTALISILPIVAFVLMVHCFFYRFESSLIVNFVIGAGILIVGLSLFLFGLEKSIVPMGEFVGNSVNGNKRFYIYIIFALVYGTCSTMAEPDFQVFTTEIILAGFPVPKFVFLAVVGFGVSVFISLALVRIVTKFSIRWTLIILFGLTLGLACFVSETNVCLSLDASVATTGSVTSPFLLAMGLGFSSVMTGGKENDDSFGLISIATLGALFASVVVCLISGGLGAGAVVEEQAATMSLWLSVLVDVSLSVIPLVIIFFVFEAIFIKISRQDKKRLTIGAVITFVGLYLYLFGVQYGFIALGEKFGEFLAGTDTFVVLAVVCLLGFFIVIAEPAIKVLADQVDEATNRNLPSKLVVGTIAVAVMLSLCLIVLKLSHNISIWWFVGICYGLSLALSFFVPKNFTAIAFDAGGVATGTLVVSFIFPMMSGFAGASTGFGVVAIVAMVPVLVVQLLGLLFGAVSRVQTRKTRRIFLKLSSTEDEFSNIEKIKREHRKKFGGEYEE